MVSESPIEVLKMRFVKGEITLEQYKAMLSELVPPGASPSPTVTPSEPPAAQAPPPSYENMVYIPPVSDTGRPKAPEPATEADRNDMQKSASRVQLLLVAVGIFVGLMAALSWGSWAGGLIMGLLLAVGLSGWQRSRNLP